MARYAGKRAVITGRTSGIELATARLLVDESARVLVTGHTQAGLDRAREELGRKGIVAESDAASLADIDQLARSREVRLRNARLALRERLALRASCHLRA
jgi:NAD(P)-dependent dehydrogenase (short-subunit alcohol dehydrogenase family)